MCGIAGWLGAAPEGADITDRLQGALRHRGPDASGKKVWSEAGLIHTRLSILDLSPSGAQPMSNEDGTVWIVFNGEIYNHTELRRKLADKGHQFRGRSDSEVLPHCYEEYGSAFLERLSGMFAFALYDTRRAVLLLARDRFGIKPLFYSQNSARIFFASELNTFRLMQGVDLEPDLQAVSDYAALCFIPAPQTFYRGVRALEPGQVIEAGIQDGVVRTKVKVFHHWVLTPDPGLGLNEAVDRADHLIRSAVQKQLESDVSLGSLLSGGIDSSLVSAAAQADCPRKLQTFNVRFPDKAYDETWAAEAVARHIGSDHRVLDMPRGTGTWENVTALLLHAGQPFADTSLFAVNAVCRLMRQHITVALSGDGGDEGFGGYHLYWQIGRIEKLQHLPPWVWDLGSLALNPLAKLRLVRGHLSQRVKSLARADDVSIVQSMFSWIQQAEHRRLCRVPGDPLRRLFEPQWTHQIPKQGSRLERLSALATEANIRVVLPNDYLFKVDTASMRESLEVRVPMLDEELVAFGLTLPHQLKVRGRQAKLVLRKVAERRLPRSVAVKKKMGFGIPVDIWADGRLKGILSDKLLAPGSPLPQFFNPEIYQPWIKAFASGAPLTGISRQGLYQRVIMLLGVYLAMERTA